jgi:hypothetical protein
MDYHVTTILGMAEPNLRWAETRWMAQAAGEALAFASPSSSLVVKKKNMIILIIKISELQGQAERKKEERESYQS